MAEQIDADTLRGWLEERRPVTVLDIRADEDRVQWAIPGSVHLNAYNDLRAGLAGPLADASFPLDVPIVTVCNADLASQTAAAILSRRGLDARSLAGGMKAWSLAWNTANVPLPGTATRVIQIRRTGKGCLSYMVGSAGDAAVIDPSGTRQRARALFGSLTRLFALGTEAMVLPAHTSEPIAFDGQAVCARMKDLAATLSEWLASEQTFVERVTSRLPATPPNFSRIVELNEAGTLPEGDPTDLEAGANRCAVS